MDVLLLPSSAEEQLIRLSTSHLWGEDLSVRSPFSLEQLLELLTPLHQDRLPRILARALLYCGQYQDTKVWPVITLHGWDKNSCSSTPP